jgi:selenocysteine-specific elongation factor
MSSIVIGTAGHIDHGKSRLVLALTGTDPDRLKEEKVRGITIDLGFAHWVDHVGTFAFVDVPGHERFVKNMLAGAGGIDAVLLVVAADEGVMPQTREHVDICHLLGIAHGIVALSKADLVNDEMLDLAREEVVALLEGSPLAGAPIVPVSATTGAGLDTLRDALRDLVRVVPARKTDGPARLPIDRSFSVRGFGTVVTGTLVSGTVADGDDLVLLPGGTTVKIRGVQVHSSKQTSAGAGHRVALNLGGIDAASITRGQTLAARGTLEPTRTIDVDLELLPSARPLRQGARLRVHQGTAEVMARVSLPPGLPEDALQPGHVTAARLRLESVLAVTRGDRFVVRAYSPPSTIGGGVVLDPHAPRSGIRNTRSTARFAQLRPHGTGSGAHDDAIRTFVVEQGLKGLSSTQLTVRAGVAPSHLTEVVARLVARDRVDEVGGTLFEPGLRSRLARRVEHLVRDFHRAQPLSDGIPREEVRARLFAGAPLPLFERVLADLDAARVVTGRDRLALAGRQVSLDPAEAEARDRLEAAIRESGLKPPDAGELPATLQLAPDLVTRVLGFLVRQKVLVKLDANYFHQEVLQQLKAQVVALKTDGVATLDVATFKDRYGVSRKYAIPLLEYLDRERITRRAGDARIVL